MKKIFTLLLTTILSFIVLFQTGCGSSYIYKFNSYAEMEKFLIEKAVVKFNSKEHSTKQYFAFPMTGNLYEKYFLYLNPTEPTPTTTKSYGTIRCFNGDNKELTNLFISPYKSIGDYNIHSTTINSVYTFRQNSKEIEFCDCQIYLFNLTEKLGIAPKKYESGEFSIEHNCETGLIINWNGENHTKCIELRNLFYDYNINNEYNFIYMLNTFYNLNCINCKNVTDIPEEVLDQWGLEYILNDIYLYTLETKNAPNGYARIVKIH